MCLEPKFSLYLAMAQNCRRSNDTMAQLSIQGVSLGIIDQEPNKKKVEPKLNELKPNRENREPNQKNQNRKDHSQFGATSIRVELFLVYLLPTLGTYIAQPIYPCFQTHQKHYNPRYIIISSPLPPSTTSPLLPSLPPSTTRWLPYLAAKHPGTTYRSLHPDAPCPPPLQVWCRPPLPFSRPGTTRAGGIIQAWHRPSLQPPVLVLAALAFLASTRGADYLYRPHVVCCPSGSAQVCGDRMHWWKWHYCTSMTHGEWQWQQQCLLLQVLTLSNSNEPSQGFVICGGFVNCTFGCVIYSLWCSGGFVICVLLPMNMFRYRSISSVKTRIEPN